MAYFEDLSACNYFGNELSSVLFAVGWIEKGKGFRTGDISSSTYFRLKELLTDPWQPMAFGGGHDCDLCQFDGSYGHSNLFVPNGKTIFVCPELILHYINCHHYQPPDEFLSAANGCPDTRSLEYKRLLLESGGRELVRRMGSLKMNNVAML